MFLIPTVTLLLAFGASGAGTPSSEGEEQETEEEYKKYEAYNEARRRYGVPELSYDSVQEQRLYEALGLPVEGEGFCVSVGRYGSKWATLRRGGKTLSFAMYVVKIYEKKPRQSDGVVTWRLFKNIDHTARSGTNGPSDRLLDVGEAIANSMGLDFDLSLRHGQKVE